MRLGVGVPLRLVLTITRRDGTPMPAVVRATGGVTGSANAQGQVSLTLPAFDAPGDYIVQVRSEYPGLPSTIMNEAVRVYSVPVSPISPPPAVEWRKSLIYDPEISL